MIDKEHFDDTQAITMQKYGTENNGMFTMSPLTSKQTDGSFSFNDSSKNLKAAGTGGSVKSTDSAPRNPFGEIQVPNVLDETEI